MVRAVVHATRVGSGRALRVLFIRIMAAVRPDGRAHQQSRAIWCIAVSAQSAHPPESLRILDAHALAIYAALIPLAAE